MANPLKLPFDFPPNTTPTTEQLQANFNALLGFVQDLDTGLTSLTNLVLSGSLSLPNGSAPAPSLKFTNSTTTGLYRVGSNNMGISTDGTAAWNADSDQNILQPLQPCFLVQKNAAQTFSENLIGFLETPITFETEIYDVGGNFNISTETFTAPITGTYIFTFKADTFNFSGALTYRFELITSNRTYTGSWGSNTLTQCMFSVLADMDATDTASMSVLAFSTGTNTGQIRDDCTFSGSLIN